jgi:hypothetical protein
VIYNLKKNIMRTNVNGILIGHAVAQVVTSFLSLWPGSVPGKAMWNLWWTKWPRDRFSRVLWFLLPILIPPTALYPLIALSLVLYAVSTDCVVKLQKERKGMLLCSVMAWNKYGYVVLWYEPCFCTLVCSSDTKLIVYKDLLCQHLEAVLMFHVWNFNSKFK